MPVTVKQMDRMLVEMQKRSKQAKRLDLYYEGCTPLPNAIVKAGITKAYRMLMPTAEAPWGSLVVDSVQDRLRVSGVNTGDKDTDKRLANEIWKPNRMDGESLLAHNTSLVTGRSFAVIWRTAKDDFPTIALDGPGTTIVMYAEGSRHERIAAMRWWRDDDGTQHCTTYADDFVYKWTEARMEERGPEVVHAGGYYWRPRIVDGEAWPLENPFDVVPVVEIPVNRRLKPGQFAYARGEYEHCIGLIDRINLLTFLGLVVAFYMGFPLRGVIGDKVLRRDDGTPIPPFDANASGMFQLENPNAQIAEYKAADRGNLSVYAELDQLSSITKTPRHYMPMQNGMSNLSADAIRASEGGLVAKVPYHHGTLGEGWEEVYRVAGLMLDSPIEVPYETEIVWQDHETRSLAERADAATKLKDLLPWQAVAEMALNASPELIAKWESYDAGGALSTLVKAANNPTDTSLNGPQATQVPTVPVPNAAG